MRLDQYLVLHHNFTRNKAQQLIDTGLVLVDQKICTKSSQSITESMQVTITEDRRVNWVSRSAEKLEGFLESNPIDIENKICLDVGSSTGWFTQVLLAHWANRVDAVDVGTDQLHSSIRSNPRVISYEQTDIRDFVTITPENQYGVIVCDASFISLSEIIDAILQFATTDTNVVLLYKPQFEVGREHLKKTGIPKDQKRVDQKMEEFEEMLHLKNTTIHLRQKSTLIGEAWNQEWIYLIQKNV